MTEPVLKATYVESYSKGSRAYTIVASIEATFTLFDDGNTAHDVFWVHGSDPKDAVKRLKHHYDKKDGTRTIEDIIAVFAGFHSPEIKP